MLILALLGMAGVCLLYREMALEAGLAAWRAVWVASVVARLAWWLARRRSA